MGFAPPDGDDPSETRSSLDRLTGDLTTLTVARRRSTVKDADTVVVLDGDEVVERGTRESSSKPTAATPTSGAPRPTKSGICPSVFVERAERGTRVDADGAGSEADD